MFTYINYAILHVSRTGIYWTVIEDVFLIFAPNIDCGVMLKPLQWGGSNESPQSMYFSQNKKNNM